jgi:hypothetical protein
MTAGHTAAAKDHWWQCWTMHNLMAHPLSELLYWIGLGDLGNRLHDATIPTHEPGTGRG